VSRQSLVPTRTVRRAELAVLAISGLITAGLVLAAARRVWPDGLDFDLPWLANAALTTLKLLLLEAALLAPLLALGLLGQSLYRETQRLRDVSLGFGISAATSLLVIGLLLNGAVRLSVDAALGDLIESAVLPLGVLMVSGSLYGALIWRARRRQR
jgi:hypothetical protein